MKKCKGCGIELQTNDENKLGYVLDINQDYCKRCFRLIHYNDISNLKLNAITNDDVFDIYEQYKDSLFVIVVDALDTLIINDDKFLDTFKDKRLFIIINKIDTLPKNVKDEKIDELYVNLLSKLNNKNILGVMLSQKNDPMFNDTFFEAINELDFNNIVVCGRANAGKSTIINKILKENILTTSVYPGTTINTNEIDIDKYHFIDTPGIVDEENITTYIDNEKLNKVLITKTIKPQVFQFYEAQSYFVEGLIRIDCLPVKRASIIFYTNNELKIHRSKYENADRYFENNAKDIKIKLLPFENKTYKVKRNQTFIIKGLGMFRINGDANIRIHINPKIQVYRSEVNI